jgi:predicted amidohydrolase
MCVPARADIARGLAGAQLIALPEACEFPPSRQHGIRTARAPGSRASRGDGTGGAARAANAWLLVGSLSVRGESGKLANRSILYTPRGEIRATYDKINLFDAAPGEKESLESRLYQRGDTAYVVDIGAAKLGLSICYDLRFPML